jgi:hypothetical protein
MKLKLILTLILTVCVTLFIAAQSQAVSITLSVLDSSITVGETFGVEVLVDGGGIGEALLAFGFDVVTPETYFSYTGYTIGPDFTDASDPFNPINVAGVGFAPTDDVLLATLDFTAIAAGTDPLDVDGAFDGLFYGLFYEFSSADIFASADITVVPEPASILLVGAGLAGLTISRKRWWRKR